MKYHNYAISDTSMSLIPREIYFENWKKYYQDYHRHDAGCLEVDYIVDGNCTYHISGKEVKLPKHSVLIHNGNNPHDFKVDDSCLNMSILFYQETLPFSGGTFSDLFGAFPYLRGFFNRLNEGIILHRANNLYPLLTELNNSYTGHTEDMYLSLLTNKLIVDLLNTAYFQSPQRVYTEQIKKYAEYHYFSISSLDDIAKALSLNKTYMQKIFKEETGTTIWNYVNEIRIRRAAALLKSADIPIGDLNEFVGINSRQNFYLLFKKTYGMSPSDFRTAHAPKADGQQSQ